MEFEGRRTSGPAAPPTPPKAIATGAVDIKQEPQQPGSAPYLNLMATVQSALKRQRETDPIEQDGDAKRPKAEPELVSEPAPDLDIGSMLESALVSYDAQHSQPTPEVDGAPAIVSESPRPLPSTPASNPPPIDRKKMPAVGQQDLGYFVRFMCLPSLGFEAVAVLRTLSEYPRKELQDFITDPQSCTGRSYRALKDLFDVNRRVFSAKSALLSIEELDIQDLEGQETIQMSNAATICASLLGAGDVPLVDVHDHFLMTFLPESGTSPEDLLRLFLSLKTQVCVEGLSGEAQVDSRNVLLERIFPGDMAEQLQQLHPDQALSEAETNFVEGAKSRRTLLQGEAGADVTRAKLPGLFAFEAFQDEVSRYLQSNKDIVSRFAESHGIDFPPQDDAGGDEPGQDSGALVGDVALSGILDATATPGTGGTESRPGVNTETKEEQLDVASSLSLGLGQLIQQSLQKEASQPPPAVPGGSMGLASLIAEKIGESASAHPHPTYAAHYSHLPRPSNIQNHQGLQFASQPRTGGPPGSDLPPNQSSSSAVLYQRARQAAAAKTSSHTRRDGGQSTRRPWAPDEEQALMTGLDMVKGPHWSQILQLFGPNGTISDILKDRNQVQLKDKARNLKLFFLKTNSEMPYYLQHVTGELKTRAPSQAARKEAEERARLTTEDEQARVQGIMTLAGGLQSNAPRPPNGAAPRAPTQTMAPRPTPVSPAPPQAQVAGVRAGPPPGYLYPQNTPRPIPGSQRNGPVAQMPQQAGVRTAGLPPTLSSTLSTTPRPPIYQPTQAKPAPGLGVQQPPPRALTPQTHVQLSPSSTYSAKQQNGAATQPRVLATPAPALAPTAAGPGLPAVEATLDPASDASLLQPLKAAAEADASLSG